MVRPPKIIVIKVKYNINTLLYDPGLFTCCKCWSVAHFNNNILLCNTTRERGVYFKIFLNLKYLHTPSFICRFGIEIIDSTVVQSNCYKTNSFHFPWKNLSISKGKVYFTCTNQTFEVKTAKIWSEATLKLCISKGIDLKDKSPHERVAWWLVVRLELCLKTSKFLIPFIWTSTFWKRINSKTL